MFLEVVTSFDYYRFALSSVFVKALLQEYTCPVCFICICTFKKNYINNTKINKKDK